MFTTLLSHMDDVDAHLVRHTRTRRRDRTPAAKVTNMSNVSAISRVVTGRAGERAPARNGRDATTKRAAVTGARRAKTRMTVTRSSATTTTETKPAGEDTWDLPRPPYEAGNAPENGTWSPTNQTIKDWRSLYKNTTLSVKGDGAGRTIPASAIEGEIPKELVGTLFRNGPGLLEIYGKKLNQFFDGDGLVYTVSFPGDGQVKLRHNFVGTKGFTEEQAAQKMIYKGAFAIGNPKGDSFYNPFDFDVKNVANTGVVNWGGETYALWEGGKPHKMKADNLATVGEVEEVLGTKLRVPQMAAHYRIWEGETEADKRLIGFSIESQASFPQNVNRAAFYEWDSQGKAAAVNNFDVPNATFGFFHDCLVTENWYFLFQNPTSLNPQKLLTEYMFAKCALAETICMVDGKNAILHCLPRTEKARKIGQKAIELKPQFFFHHVNAFERENGEVVLDSLPWVFMDFSMNLDSVNPAFFNGGSRVEYTRFVVDPVRERCTQTVLNNRVGEFPTMNNKFVGREYTHAYSAGTVVKDDVKWGPNQCLVKHTSEPGNESPVKEQVWYYGERCFVQEPIFAPRPGGTAEDDGWVLQVVNNAGAETSKLHIFDAKDISKGPIASVLFEGEHLPPGLHGMWSKDAVY
jgi:all-trans-8'-apo-beta-carotenal 15,15'-oxygenase